MLLLRCSEDEEEQLPLQPSEEAVLAKGRLKEEALLKKYQVKKKAKNNHDKKNIQK